MSEEEKYGGEEVKLDDTLDCINYAKKMLTDAAGHKSDDGKIDTMEAASMMISNAPAAFKAFVGRENVDDELKHLNQEELKILAKEGMDVVRLAFALFSKPEAKEESKE